MSAIYLTVADLAARYQISADTIYRNVSDKKWPSVKIGSRIRFSPDDQREIEAMITLGSGGGTSRDRIAQALRQVS